MPTTVNLVTNKSDRPLTDQQTKQETNTVSKNIIEAIDHILSFSKADIFYDIQPGDESRQARDLKAFFGALYDLEIFRNTLIIHSDPVSVVEYIERNAENLGFYKNLTLFEQSH